MKKIVLLIFLTIGALKSYCQVPISGLPAATTADSTNIFPIVQSGTTKKLTLKILKDWLGGYFSPITLATHTNGYGLSGSAYNGSTARTWIVDTTALATQYDISSLGGGIHSSTFKYFRGSGTSAYRDVGNFAIGMGNLSRRFSVGDGTGSEILYTVDDGTVHAGLSAIQFDLYPPTKYAHLYSDDSVRVTAKEFLYTQTPYTTTHDSDEVVVHGDIAKKIVFDFYQTGSSAPTITTIFNNTPYTISAPANYLTGGGYSIDFSGNIFSDFPNYVMGVHNSSVFSVYYGDLVSLFFNENNSDANTAGFDIWVGTPGAANADDTQTHFKVTITLY